VTLPDKQASDEEHRLAKLEPFGFVDGVSQPIIRGTYKSFRGADAIHIVEPGEFVLGYRDNRGTLPAAPTLGAVHDPENRLPIAAPPEEGFATPVVNLPRDVGRNGTFLAVRQLEQDVTGFWACCEAAAAMVKSRFPQWRDVTKEFIGAKLVGRWPDGSSLVRYPYRAGSEEAADEHPMVRPAAGMVTLPGQPAPPPAASSVAIKQAEAPARPRSPVRVERTDAPVRPVAITPDNDFLFGAEDPQGLRCPLGAHIRRANPRDAFEPGSEEQLAITNRHRILRVGRRYQPRDGGKPGLFFMCLNADLERQFEFVQQTWLQSPTFNALAGERDPVVGTRIANDGDADDGFTIPTREAPMRLRAMPQFVHTLGGGYFFVPGRSLLRFLAS
jgi:deferrochelatase/peroxidase EfeB